MKEGEYAFLEAYYRSKPIHEIIIQEYKIETCRHFLNFF